MFIGEYTNTLDAKNRLSVPAKFRKDLGDKAVLVYGLNKSLALYPMIEWEKYAEKLAGLSMGDPAQRQYARTILAGAFEVEFDKVGRMVVPEQQRAFAGMSAKVVFTGMYKYAELWDEAAWKEYQAKAVAETDSIAEMLGERI